VKSRGITKGPHGLGVNPLALSNGVLQCVGVIEQGLRLRQQLTPERVQVQAAPVPVEQRLRQRRFQLRQRRTDRRLRQAELVAGRCGGLAARHGREDRPLAQRHAGGFVIHKTGYS